MRIVSHSTKHFKYKVKALNIIKSKTNQVKLLTLNWQMLPDIFKCVSINYTPKSKCILKVL